MKKVIFSIAVYQVEKVGSISLLVVIFINIDNWMWNMFRVAGKASLLSVLHLVTNPATLMIMLL